MGDLAGLDIGWVKEKSHGETIRDVLCEMDRRGQKTGAGSYDYDPETRAAKPSPVTEKIINDFVAKSGVNPRTISDEEILERCLYPMVNEGAKILEEGKAIRSHRPRMGLAESKRFLVLQRPARRATIRRSSSAGASKVAAQRPSRPEARGVD